MKKIIMNVLPIAMLLVLPMISYAIPAIELDYWYSDASEVFIWTDKTHNVYVNDDYSNVIDVDDLEAYAENAYNKWESATGIEISKFTSSSVDMGFWAMSREKANELDIPSNVGGIGFVEATDLELVYNGYYGASKKEIYETSGIGRVYVIDDLMDDISTTGKKRVITHELGHALGYIGHYNDNGIMKSVYEDIATSSPSSDNEDHLSQLY